MPRQKLRTEAFQGIGAALGIEPGRSPEFLQTDEAFPTLDLKRFVEAERAVIYTGTQAFAHAGSGTLSRTANPHDTADWTSFTGPLRSPYNEKVPLGYDIIILGIGSFLSGTTVGNWSSSRAYLRLSGSNTTVLPIFMSEKAIGSLVFPEYSRGPIYWPSHSVAGEYKDMSFISAATGADVNETFSIYMLAAPRGVLPRLP